MQELEAFLKERYKDWEGKVQFEGSGYRFLKFLGEMCWTTDFIHGEVEKCFKAVYEDSYSEMLVCGPISIYTLCPHHFLPCHFKVHIGYIPNGRVLGLSKFGRVAVLLGKRPIMQEQYSRELANELWEWLKPEGVGVRVVGRHGCMEVRGIRQDGLDVVTSVLKGSFLERPEVRKEFFDLVGQ